MANGYYERGEIYMIRLDNGIGNEEGTFRPGLIISSDQGNRTNGTVVVAYLTTKDHDYHINVETMATGRLSNILTNQVATIDKRRMKQHMGTLSVDEMATVERSLRVSLGIGADPEVKEKEREIEALNAEIAELKLHIGRAEQTELSYKVEVAMWQKLYERALDQLVEFKLGRDMARMSVVESVEEKAEEPVEEPAEEPVEEKVEEKVGEAAENKVDINSCTITALRKLGFTVGMAKAVVEHRPYVDVSELREVPGVKATVFRVVEPKLCCSMTTVGVEPEPVEPVTEKASISEKVNINTATCRELAAVGIPYSTASKLTGYRKKNGPYTSLDDMLGVNHISKKWVDRYRDKLTV